jgi:hypothetical protein
MRSLEVVKVGTTSTPAALLWRRGAGGGGGVRCVCGGVSSSWRGAERRPGPRGPPPAGLATEPPAAQPAAPVTRVLRQPRITRFSVQEHSPLPNPTPHIPTPNPKAPPCIAQIQRIRAAPKRTLLAGLQIIGVEALPAVCTVGSQAAAHAVVRALGGGGQGPGAGGAREASFNVRGMLRFGAWGASFVGASPTRPLPATGALTSPTPRLTTAADLPPHTRTCASSTSRASPCIAATMNTRLRRFGTPKPLFGGLDSGGGARTDGGCRGAASGAVGGVGAGCQGRERPEGGQRAPRGPRLERPRADAPGNKALPAITEAPRAPS